MNRKTQLAAPITLAPSTLTKNAPNRAAPAAEVDRVLDRWIGSGRIVGSVVIVARKGEVAFRRVAGFADREAGIPMTENAIFRHASMSKLITSATALALVDEGRLSLDAPMTNWLPWFAPALGNGHRPVITVRQLMTHTAGLSYAIFEPPGNEYETKGIPSGLGHEIMTLRDAARRIASAPLFYEPGTEWRYSIATDVLGAVIEAASNRSLPDAVSHYVTGPLEMSDTAFVATDPGRLTTAYRDGDGRAARMNQAGDRIPLGENGAPVWPGRVLEACAYPSGGGGMSGTTGDYLRLIEAIRTGGTPILSPASAEAIGEHAIGTLRAWTEGEGWGHGLGAAVLLDSDAAQTPQNHGTFQWGGALGSHWFVDPVAGLSVVVLTNTSVAGVIGAFPSELRSAIYSEFGD